MEDLAGREIAGYQIGARIGESLCAVVYRARELGSGRELALKLLKPELAANPTVVESFRQAAAVAAALAHPNILATGEARCEQGLCFLPMAYAEGGSLRTRLAAGKLRPEDAVRLVEDLAAALDYAHGKGVIHGDINPNNVFFDKSGRAMLADFGLSRALTIANPYTQLLAPEYMTPEQAQGLAIDKRADIYALGLVAYEAIAGRVPFKADSPLGTLYEQVHQAPPSLAALGIELPGLQAALERALSKDPEVRYESAGEMAKAVSAAAAFDIEAATRYTGAGLSAAEAPTQVNREPRAGAGWQGAEDDSVISRSALAAREVQAAMGPGATGPAAGGPPLGPVPGAWGGAGGAMPPVPPGPATSPTYVLPPQPAGKHGLLLALAGAGAGVLLVAIIVGTMLYLSGRNKGGSPTPAVVAVAASAAPAAATATEAPSATPSATASPTPSPAPTSTLTATATAAATATATASATPAATDTPAPMPTDTATPAPQPTDTPTVPAIVQPTVALATDTPVPPTATPASALTLSGHIAYTLLAGANPSVWLAGADGSGQHQVLACMRQPDLSSGGRLAMNGQGCGTDSLWAINEDGSDKREISRHPDDEHPTWSPDNSMIVYASTQQGDGQWRLYTHSVMGQPPQAPPAIRFGGNTIFGRFPVWLPDGEIAYSGCDYGFGSGANCGLWLTTSSGGQPRRLTTDASDRAADGFGDSVVFMSTRDGNWEVYRVRLDGSGLTRLTNSPANDGLPTWSPDGSAIAFLSDRDGQWAIWAMKPDGSGQQKLFNLNGAPGANWTEERVSWGP